MLKIIEYEYSKTDSSINQKQVREIEDWDTYFNDEVSHADNRVCKGIVVTVRTDDYMQFEFYSTLTKTILVHTVIVLKD